MAPTPTPTPSPRPLRPIRVALIQGVLALTLWADLAIAKSTFDLSFQDGVDPAPSAVDTTRPPLRQLIEDVSNLNRTRKRLNRTDLVNRSNVIANRVNHLIGKVQAIQSEWMDGGIMPPHPLLLEASNSLYASVRALRIALPGEALPEMKKAATAIRDFRNGVHPDSVAKRSLTPTSATDTATARPKGKPTKKSAKGRARPPRTTALS